MPEFLIGIMFHEPEPFAQWKSGLIEDYESSVGLFVEADSLGDALSWGKRVGQALLRYVNGDENLDWDALGYYCWLEEDPLKSSWAHNLEFFQHIRIGGLPKFEQMTAASFARWLKSRPQ